MYGSSFERVGKKERESFVKQSHKIVCFFILVKEVTFVSRRPFILAIFS